MSEARLPLFAVLLIATAAAILPTLRAGPVAGLAVALLVTSLGAAVVLAPLFRRRRIERAPFPESQRRILEADVEAYRRLSTEERRRFERAVAVFLAEQRITGPRGAPLDEELRVLVAASAVIVAFGRRGFHYPRTRDVVVYEGAFDESYRDDTRDPKYLGMVHGAGPILLSAQALRDGFRNPHDGRNVGLHELAHVLDFDVGHADGFPAFMPWRAVDPWLRLVHDETRRVRAHQSILREYAATNEAEFFAVATEMFFEQPRRLRDKHPRLYDLLRQAYAQDPAEDPRERRAKDGHAAREPA